MIIKISIMILVLTISIFLFKIYNIVNKVYYSKFIDENFDIYSYIDSFISQCTYMYISNNFKNEFIEDDLIPKIYTDITVKYISCISDTMIKKISLYVRKDRIFFIISERIDIIVPKIIKEYNKNVERGNNNG